jgi:uncharacterized membrane protein
MSRLTAGVYGEESVSDHAPVLASHRLRPAGEGSVRAARSGVLPGQLSRRLLARTSLVLAFGGVLTQIAYPLLTGAPLRVATVLSVLLFAAAGVLHAGLTWGPGAGAVVLLVVAGGLGLAAETLGVHTGFPFGDYHYSGGLGAQLAEVPIVVPLAWTMLAYPCLLLGRRLSGTVSRAVVRLRPNGGHFRLVSPVITILLGGLGLAGWDLFLDPQMVAQGNWSWAHPSPALPGVPGVPLTNYAGWLLVSMVIIAALDRALPDRPPNSELIPAVVLAWTWLGSAIGNLAFFDRPWVALYGGLVMGAVTLPYLLALRSEHVLDQADGRTGGRGFGPPARPVRSSADRAIEDQV